MRLPYHSSMALEVSFGQRLLYLGLNWPIYDKQVALSFESPWSLNMLGSLWCCYLCNCEFIYLVHLLIFIQIPHVS